MKKKLLLPLLAATMSATAQAQDFPYLVLVENDESKTVLSVESLSISVSDGTLKISNNDGTKSFTLSDLNKMFFSTDGTSAISLTEAATDDEVEVTTVAGLPVGRYASIEKAQASLKPGLYVMKSKNVKLKIAVK